ncbi:MAG: hypothetical protein LBG16_04185, partial [Elusimicrobiota bacterium]|nr:hypothetical protein [Elusimicrobiota bacterium]
MQKFIQKEKLKKLGRFFKSHTVITALIFAVVFMSLPFFFKDNSAVKDFTDKYIQKPLSWITGNPLSAKFKTLAGDYKVGVKNILGAFGGSAAREETETARADEARGSAYREPQSNIILTQQGPAQISGTGGKEYVRVDGNEIYQVFTDDKGRKFVVTD